MAASRVMSLMIQVISMMALSSAIVSFSASASETKAISRVIVNWGRKGGANTKQPTEQSERVATHYQEALNAAPCTAASVLVCLVYPPDGPFLSSPPRY